MIIRIAFANANDRHKLGSLPSELLPDGAFDGHRFHYPARNRSSAAARVFDLLVIAGIDTRKVDLDVP